MSRILKYEQKDTWIDELTGVTKLLFFLLWSVVSMITYDTRVLLVMLVFSVIIFRMSRISWKQVGTVFKFILLFLCLNLVMVFFFSPFQGCKIYGSRTELTFIWFLLHDKRAVVL